MKKILLVIDMQNDFIKGSLGDESKVNIINQVYMKLKKAKENKDIIIFTKDTHFENYLETLEGTKLPVPHCIKNTNGWEIIDELKEFVDESIVLEKNTFGYLDYQKLFEEKNIQDLPIELIGVCTDICVVSNALILRALYPNKDISVYSSCVSATTEDNNNAALKVMASCQINIVGDDVIEE